MTESYLYRSSCLDRESLITSMSLFFLFWSFNSVLNSLALSSRQQTVCCESKKCHVLCMACCGLTHPPFLCHLPCSAPHLLSSVCEWVWVFPQDKPSGASVFGSHPSVGSAGSSTPGAVLWLSPGLRLWPLSSSAMPTKWVQTWNILLLFFKFSNICGKNLT